MCGFAGIYSFSYHCPDISNDLLKKMSDTIAHRGPDDEGSFISKNGNLGFSFRRLSIIDLSPAGHQPMSNADQSVWIIFNGEIYNHLILREELEKAGYSYRSRSDTETIIYAYQHWGERFVEKLEGMFAIALWDEKRETLLLYRDRIGIKPLYYTRSNGQIIFGSEIKAILQHPGVASKVNETALYHYLTYIHAPAPLTLYDGIFKIEAGHYLKILKDGNVHNTQYWDVITTPDPSFDYSNEDLVAEQLRELFSKAVEKRMMSDVPFGVFLSGGIDSSANVAYMARMMNRPVDTFTVAIKGQEDTNEFQWARRISKLFKTNHHEIIIDDKGFLDLLPTIIHHQDEPLADPVCFPLYHVSKLARDNGTIVVQVGEGSDELFSGYQSYLRAISLIDKYSWIQRLPAFIRKSAYFLGAPFLAARKIDYRQNVIRNLLESEPVFWGNAIAFYEKEKQRLLNSSYLDHINPGSSYFLAREKFESIRASRKTETLDEIIYWEVKNRLAELLLMRVDKITMAASIEARVPFLDHKIVEFAMNIPASLKTRNGTTKYILKKAFRDVLPNEIIDRRKIGFAGSGKNMLTQEIFNHAKSILLSSVHGYFDLDYLRNLLAEYEKRRINYTPQIWALYNFELWHRQWIEGKTNF